MVKYHYIRKEEKLGEIELAKWIPIIIMIVLAIVLGGIGFFFFGKNRRSKLCTQHTLGTVVKYSVNSTRAPVVEYIVEGQKYRKALKYTAVITTSNPFNSVKTTAEDLLAPKLRIRSNSAISFNTLMKDTFPLGSQMNVYYRPDKPKEAFVERYAKDYLGTIFLIGAGTTLFTAILLSIIL